MQGEKQVYAMEKTGHRNFFHVEVQVADGDD